MKLDAHCAVDEGFDVKLAQDCEYDWTMIPRMYNLDVDTWLPKLIDDKRLAVKKRKLHDYMYIGWNDKNELRTLYYGTKENRKQHDKSELIDDVMSCMGCCFFMHMDRFWELEGCDEGHGGWGQQGIEVALKAWLSGGSLKVNKKTWFAHWFRASDGGFPYSISGNAIKRARDYSMDLWLQNKWPLQKRKIEWIIEKFSPPSWEGRLGVPEGRWYQEANINGVEMPRRRKNDSNEERWNEFIKPLITLGHNEVVDAGCNAGFYSRKMKALGYKVTGIEQSVKYFNHAKYWEEQSPKGIKLINDSLLNYDYSQTDMVLMANVHYWITEKDLFTLSEKFKNISKLIIIGRHKHNKEHISKPDLETLKKYFTDFTLEKVIMGKSKMGKKHYSVLFTKKHKNIKALTVQECFPKQNCSKSTRLYPSFKKMIETGDITDYQAYLKRRKFRNIKKTIKRHKHLIADMKAEKKPEPIVMDGDFIVDGVHRLIVAFVLGWKTIDSIPGKLKKKQ